MTEGEALVHALSELEAAGIPYVYLRNYENLPEDIGNDVDLLIPNGSRSQALQVLDRALAARDWFVFKSVQFGPLSVYVGDRGGKRIFHVDLFEELEWHWLPLADAEVVRAQRRWNGLVFCPAPGDELVVNIVTRLLYEGRIREKHRRQAENLLGDAGREEVESAFERHLGAGLGAELAAAATEGAWERLEREARSLRNRFIKQQSRRNPGKCLFGIGRYLKRTAVRILRPPGPFIAFEGADGVGKSSVMEALLPWFKDFTGRADTMLFHWKPSAASVRTAGDPPGPAQDPRGKRRRSQAASLFYLGYHWTGFWVGYFRYVFPALARNRAVVGDRYAYEFSLDPERLRLNLPPWLLKLASQGVPQPQAVVALWADPAVVIDRKPELSVQEIESYQAGLHQMAQGDSRRFLLVEANAGLEATVERVRQQLFERLRRKS